MNELEKKLLTIGFYKGCFLFSLASTLLFSLVEIFEGGYFGTSALFSILTIMFYFMSFNEQKTLKIDVKYKPKK